MNLHCVPNWAVHDVLFPKIRAAPNSTDYGFDKTEELIWKDGQLSLQIISPPLSPATVQPAKELLPTNKHEKQVDKTFDSNLNQEDTPLMGNPPVKEVPFHEQHPVAAAPEPAPIKVSAPTPAASFTAKHPGLLDEKKRPAAPEPEPETEPEPEPEPAEISVQVPCSDLNSVIGQAVSEVVGSCSVMPGPRGRGNNNRLRYVSDADEKDTATSIFLKAPKYSNSGNGKLDESEPEFDPITSPKVKKKLKVNGRSSIVTKQSRSPPSNRKRRRNKMKRKMKRDDELSRLQELMVQIKKLDAEFKAHAMHAQAQMASPMMMMPMMNMGMERMGMPVAGIPLIPNHHLFSPSPFMPQFPFTNDVAAAAAAAAGPTANQPLQTQAPPYGGP